MLKTPDIKPPRTSAAGCRDKALLVGAALLVCAIGGAAFWISDAYLVNPAWVFFLLNSIVIVLWYTSSPQRDDRPVETEA